MVFQDKTQTKILPTELGPRHKLAIAEPGKFVQEMRSEYGDNGIGNMSDEDLHRDATFSAFVMFIMYLLTHYILNKITFKVCSRFKVDRSVVTFEVAYLTDKWWQDGGTPK